MNRTEKTVKGTLKEIRLRRGLSQVDLAEAIGVSKKSISNWECGVRVPSITQIHQIAKVLDVAPADLVGHIDTPRDNNFSYIMPDDSMHPEIMPGDTLTISKTDEINDGDIVLVERNTNPPSSIIRRLYSFGKNLSLLAVNSSVAPINATHGDLTIMGKVTELKRKI